MKYIFSFLMVLFFQSVDAQTDVKIVVKNLRKVEGNLSI